MKTAMALAAAIIMSSLAVHSLAMPISPHQSNVGGGKYDQLRNKRAISAQPTFDLHNYVKTVFDLRLQALLNGCVPQEDSCNPVSQHHCTATAIKFHSPSESIWFCNFSCYECKLNDCVITCMHVVLTTNRKSSSIASE